MRWGGVRREQMSDLGWGNKVVSSKNHGPRRKIIRELEEGIGLRTIGYIPTSNCA